MAFIFYDTQTTGTHTRFDQILQFAAVLTDDDLKPIDIFDIRCRLQPHMVASPGAMQVTGVTAAELHDPLLPSHYEMCRQINAGFQQWSPATIVGYNSLSFDEEMLRSAFYQSLLPIFVTNMNGNSRFDILKLARAVYRFQPDAIKWPTNYNGKVSFKLDQLAPANGFTHANAHEAIADVEATIFMVRLIRQKAREIWDHLFDHRTKKAATDLLMTAPLVTASAFERSNGKSSLVTGLKVNPEFNGQVFCFDLALDPEPYIEASDEQLAEAIASGSHPLTIVRVNSCPVLMPLEIGGPHCVGYDLGREELARCAELVRADPAFADRFVDAYLEQAEPYPKNHHVEEQIFDGFYGEEDNDRINHFHQLPWNWRAKIAADIEDSRLKTLTLRLIYNEAPETMPMQLKASYDKAIAERLLPQEETANVPWTTLSKAIAEAEKILESDPENELIREHLADLKGRRDALKVLLQRG